MLSVTAIAFLIYALWQVMDHSEKQRSAMLRAMGEICIAQSEERRNRLPDTASWDEALEALGTRFPCFDKAIESMVR